MLSRPRTLLLVTLTLVTTLLTAISIYLVVLTLSRKMRLDPTPGVYSSAAVSTDNPLCSVIGKDILSKGGTAVDAAVGAFFCAGVAGMQSSGIGGGGLALIYEPKNKQTYAYDYKETSPRNVTEELLLASQRSSTQGGFSIGVPGEVKGLYTIWRRHGRLKWADLVEPAIHLAETGFPFSRHAAIVTNGLWSRLQKDQGLRDLLTINSEIWRSGETVRNPLLAKTLKIIRDNPLSFYNGSLATQIVKDIQDAEGVITMTDLQEYDVVPRKTYKFALQGDLTVHVMGPPSSGILLGLMINIVKGYNFTQKDSEVAERRVGVYHKIIETMKFAYGIRGMLSDPSFADPQQLDEVIQDILSQSKADDIRINKIWPNQTHDNTSYYGVHLATDDHGTSHISVLDKDGMAVSATNSINFFYGSGFRSLATGIIYNNHMNDFSIPGKNNIYKFPLSPFNRLAPGKRPLSTMAPLIVTDKNGKVIMVLGASGGAKIISALAEVVINKCMLSMDFGQAIVEPRFHNQLTPNQVLYERDFPLPNTVLKELQKLGHKLRSSSSKAIVQGIFFNGTHIIAKADPRKRGISEGY